MRPTHFALFHTNILSLAISKFNHQDDIFKCLLVNSSWAKIVVRVLWKSPIWRTKKSYQKFLSSLIKPKTKYPYGEFVEKLIFTTHPTISSFPFTIQSLDLISERCINTKFLIFDCQKSLSLDYNDYFPPEVLSMFLTRCSKLIYLKGPRFTTVDWMISALRPIQQGSCPNLKSLNMSWDWRDSSLNNLFYDIGLHCQQITSLNITTDINDKRTAEIIVDSFPLLEKFSCLTINYLSLRIIINGCRHLNFMKLEFSPELNDDYALTLANAFPSLNSFTLIRGWLDLPKFFKAWAINQKKLRHIEFLDYSHLSFEMFQPIIQLCTNLESIKLGNCDRITDNSITYLAKHRGRNLKHLSLHYANEITDIGINSISEHCRFLQTLNIFECPKITADSIINIIKRCRFLVELSGNYSVTMISPIIQSIISVGSPKLEIFSHSLLSLNISHVRRTVNSNTLAKLGRNLPKLRKFDIRYPIKGINPKILESHPRLKEIWFLTQENSKVEQYVRERSNANVIGVHIILGILYSEEEF
ncbi:8821_t:CDS:2 [Diversispora eburnea]|uniref:8821_t:CDS:1 n=1 Tax=Diversispora eburnea TaxID=1213867 RepID=A0A9N8VXV7_9GLOM|nr:8821_t:CDS:2 [Diversispora eburnea]